MYLFLYVLSVLLTLGKVGYTTTQSYADQRLLTIEKSKAHKGLVHTLLIKDDADFHQTINSLFTNPDQQRWQTYCSENNFAFSGVNVFFSMNKVLGEIDLSTKESVANEKRLKTIQQEAQQGMLALLGGVWGILSEAETKKYYQEKDIELVRQMTRSLGARYGRGDNYEQIPVLDDSKLKSSPALKSHHQAAESLLLEGWVTVEGGYKKQISKIINLEAEGLTAKEQEHFQENEPGLWGWAKSKDEIWVYKELKRFNDIPIDIIRKYILFIDQIIFNSQPLCSNRECVQIIKFLAQQPCINFSWLEKILDASILEKELKQLKRKIKSILSYLVTEPCSHTISMTTESESKKKEDQKKAKQLQEKIERLNVIIPLFQHEFEEMFIRQGENIPTSLIALWRILDAAKKNERENTQKLSILIERVADFTNDPLDYKKAILSHKKIGNVEKARELCKKAGDLIRPQISIMIDKETDLLTILLIFTHKFY